jgi:hypothetical protein
MSKQSTQQFRVTIRTFRLCENPDVAVPLIAYFTQARKSWNGTTLVELLLTISSPQAAKRSCAKFTRIM